MRRRGPKPWRKRARIRGSITFAVAVWTLTACSGDSAPLQRGILLHELSSCPLPTEPSAVALEALGDFAAGPLTSERLTAADVGRELSFPESTRAVSVATEGLTEHFWGLSSATSDGELDVLFWPEARVCDLAGDDLYPAPGGGQALAHHASEGLVLVAGGDAGQSSAVVGALTFHTRTGTAHAVDASARHVLLEPRAYAAAAPFGDDLIVTGGENPILSSPGTRPVHDTAEVFLVRESRFSTDLVALRVPRTRHAATPLPSGEVLLLGGRSVDGAALSVLEVISPQTRSSSLGGLASLRAPRVNPHVVRLSDGRLLVAGGTDDEQRPVQSFEWLSADASEHLAEVSSPSPAYESALVALPGGGALYVAGCAPAENEETCAPCALGCPTEPTHAAVWIRPNGELDTVELPASAPKPLLVAGDNGSPWLVTGSAAAPLFRFNPWRARFEPATLRGAPLEPVGPLVSVDLGAFVWLDGENEPRLRGTRAGTRDRFARDVALLTLTAPLDSSWPLHLAPSAARTEFPFDGSLTLLSEPAWLTDVDFANVDVEVTFDGQAPLLWLSPTQPSFEPQAFGGTARPWPEDSASSARLTRRGAEIVLERGRVRLAYAAPSGRVSLGFARRGGEPSRLTRLTVTRRD